MSSDAPATFGHAAGVNMNGGSPFTRAPQVCHSKDNAVVSWRIVAEHTHGPARSALVDAKTNQDYFTNPESFNKDDKETMQRLTEHGRACVELHAPPESILYEDTQTGRKFTAAEQSIPASVTPGSVTGTVKTPGRACNIYVVKHKTDADGNVTYENVFDAPPPPVVGGRVQSVIHETIHHPLWSGGPISGPAVCTTDGSDNSVELSANIRPYFTPEEHTCMRLIGPAVTPADVHSIFEQTPRTAKDAPRIDSTHPLAARVALHPMPPTTANIVMGHGDSADIGGKAEMRIAKGVADRLKQQLVKETEAMQRCNHGNNIMLMAVPVTGSRMPPVTANLQVSTATLDGSHNFIGGRVIGDTTTIDGTDEGLAKDEFCQPNPAVQHVINVSVNPEHCQTQHTAGHFTFTGDRVFTGTHAVTMTDYDGQYEYAEPEEDPNEPEPEPEPDSSDETDALIGGGGGGNNY